MLPRYAKILSLCAFSAFLAGCSQYSKMLRSEDPQARLEYAKQLFEKQDYLKVIKVLEPVYQSFKTTKEAENADWMMGYSWYMDGDYELAGYMLSSFASTYPMNPKSRRAAFLSAESSYKLSPESYLDQENTERAMVALQRYIDRYPSDSLVVRADSMMRELNRKLDKKAFEIAYNYYRMEEYEAAVKAFTNVLEDNPSTTYQEKLMYFRFRGAAIYAYKSIADKQQERYADALGYGRFFLKQYPDSPYAKEVRQLVEGIEQRSSALDVILKQGSKDLSKMKTKKLNKEVTKEVRHSEKKKNHENKE